MVYRPDFITSRCGYISRCRKRPHKEPGPLELSLPHRYLGVPRTGWIRIASSPPARQRVVGERDDRCSPRLQCRMRCDIRASRRSSSSQLVIRNKHLRSNRLIFYTLYFVVGFGGFHPSYWMGDGREPREAWGELSFSVAMGDTHFLQGQRTALLA